MLFPQQRSEDSQKIQMACKSRARQLFRCRKIWKNYDCRLKIKGKQVERPWYNIGKNRSFSTKTATILARIDQQKESIKNTQNYKILLPKSLAKIFSPQPQVIRWIDTNLESPWFAEGDILPFSQALPVRHCNKNTKNAQTSLISLHFRGFQAKTSLKKRMCSVIVAQRQETTN